MDACGILLTPARSIEQRSTDPPRGRRGERTPAPLSTGHRTTLRVNAAQDVSGGQPQRLARARRNSLRIMTSPPLRHRRTVRRVRRGRDVGTRSGGFRPQDRLPATVHRFRHHGRTLSRWHPVLTRSALLDRGPRSVSTEARSRRTPARRYRCTSSAVPLPHCFERRRGRVTPYGDPSARPPSTRNACTRTPIVSGI